MTERADSGVSGSLTVEHDEALRQLIVSTHRGFVDCSKHKLCEGRAAPRGICVSRGMTGLHRISDQRVTCLHNTDINRRCVVYLPLIYCSTILVFEMRKLLLLFVTHNFHSVY